MYKMQQRDVHFTIAELRLRTLAMFSMIHMRYFRAHLLRNDQSLNHGSGPTDDVILAFYS
jgi:hypothetical protein